MKNILALCATLVVWLSCKPVADTNYMQNIEEIATGVSVKNAVTVLQTGDQLGILVSAKDMDVVKPFNQNWSSAEVNQYTTPGGNLGTAPQQTAAPLYLIGQDGTIDFPVLGKIEARGHTLDDLKQNLEARLRRYIREPSAAVKMLNFKVTVLGEVNKPGQYIIPEGGTTVLGAIGLAGDLTLYGKRDNLLIVRNTEGVITKTYLDLTDAAFINSPYFQLQQNDVIYVSANETRQKTARLDPNAGIYISVASIVVTILALIIKR